MQQSTPLLPGLSPVAGKPLTATFDAGLMSSDGGLIVLRESALRLGVADVVGTPLPDTRNPLLVIHSYCAMVTARMMAIAAGYEGRRSRCAAQRSGADDRLQPRAGGRPRHSEPADHLAA